MVPLISHVVHKVHLKKNPLAIVIENEDYAKTMRMVFELAWQGAE
jgi:hypothetical protein